MNEITLAPQTMTELTQFAELAAKTDMVPKAYHKNPSAIVVAVMMGHELGLPPLAALQNIAVINGRPSVWGDALLAIVQGSGQLEDINEEWDAKTKTATCHYKRKGYTAQSATFSMEDAALAGLTKKQGPWQQYPQRMCKLRARGFALRDGFADQLRGIGIAEEQRDKEQAERDVTPRQSVSALKRPEPKLVERDETDDLVAKVTQTINKARSQAELKKAGLLIQSLDDLLDGERGQLREIYALRLKELKAESEAMTDGAA